MTDVMGGARHTAAAGRPPGPHDQEHGEGSARSHPARHRLGPPGAAGREPPARSSVRLLPCAVLCAARDGGTVADIAAELHLSEGTVRNHLSAAIGKTGARTRAEAVRLAGSNGWLLGDRSE